ncbi:hypothetical protein [Microcoleus sp. S28C3]|uniref:hypothetical protein n=1 Tax=Microcoleus sp. S28C3 TaxID=3055414 RepID=UPI002FD0E23F
MMFLMCALFFWFLSGWLADYSFPFGQALDLMLACFKGTISAKINSLQQQLQRTDVVTQPNNKKQVQKLNNLESQAWLYEGILERLGTDPSANHERIARTLEALEYKRSEILQELEPRRPRSYRVLAEIQDSARVLLASQAEKDYEQLQKILTNLILFTRSRQPSQIIISEAITKLASEIVQNTNKISPYRLRLAYKIDELMKVLSAKILLVSDSSSTDSNYQSLVDELRNRVSLLSKEFNNLLIAKQEDTNDLNRRLREISNLTNIISELQRDISNRNADIVALQSHIQNLTELVQEKQAQLDSQTSDFRWKYQNLYEHYKQQQDEIVKLKQNINNSSQVNRSQSSTYRSQTSQQPVQKTKSSITIEEYQKIVNKSDYVYVKAHQRSNGSYVKAHYRRKRH